MEIVSEILCFDGIQNKCKHPSTATKTSMNFGVFMPQGKGPFPVLYWLSGLTCTEENFISKAGAQRVASELKLAIVAPDTSPRGEAVPDDPEGAYDLGLGAGFYVDAKQTPWARHYQMYSYVTKELPSLIEHNFPVDASRTGIFGHSMGGHGALTIHLRNSDKFRTCSAFAPIVAPSSVPWGQKAFSNYLGSDQKGWGDYDASVLVSKQPSNAEILIDQGEADSFLSEQLRPEHFIKEAEKANQRVTLRMHPGYDHSYYFIASFMEDHLRWHAKRLYKMW